MEDAYRQGLHQVAQLIDAAIESDEEDKTGTAALLDDHCLRISRCLLAFCRPLFADNAIFLRSDLQVDRRHSRAHARPVCHWARVLHDVAEVLH